MSTMAGTGGHSNMMVSWTDDRALYSLPVVASFMMILPYETKGSSSVLQDLTRSLRTGIRFMMSPEAMLR